VFLRCMADDINNLVKSVLKTDFSIVAEQASHAVNCLNAASAKWLVDAQSIMKRTYGIKLKFYALCATR
jgi:hypothetical protein